MTTTAFFDYSVSGQLVHAGAAPITGGMISFPVAKSGRQSIDASSAVAEEITIGDTVLETGNYNFRIVANGEGGLKYHDDEVVLGNDGQPVAYFANCNLLYLESNVAAEITGDFTGLQGIISQNGVILIKSGIPADTSETTDTVMLQISWSAADIASVGSANFRAKLIFA